MQGSGAVQDAQTITVRVQVVDVESAALDLVLPTYLPAKDVSQRIAMDAGLGRTWPDGTRRTFWLRARGRLLGEEERLADLGVRDGELIHILPQPPEGDGLHERFPDYPRTVGYRGGRLGAALTALATVGFIALLWSISLTIPLSLWLAIPLGVVPPLAIGTMLVGVARHIWGPPGSSFRVPLTGLGLVVIVMGVFAGAGVGLSDSIESAAIPALLGLFFSFIGIFIGWMSWYGAVEPLPEHESADVMEAARVEANVAQCVICSLDVDLSDAANRQDCVYQCGRVFHAGCYRARAAIARPGTCAVCGYAPEAPA